MEIFDKKPHHFGRRFIAVAAATVVAFGAPMVINAALPKYEAPDETVGVAQDVNAGGWEITTADVEGLECPVDPMAMGDRGWTCGEASVATQTTTGAEDLNTTAKRGVRNAGMVNLAEVDNAVIAGTGDSRIAVDPDINTVAIVQALGDDTYATTTATGPADEVRDIAAKLWDAIGSRELPAAAADAIDEFSTETPVGLLDDAKEEANRE